MTPGPPAGMQGIGVCGAANSTPRLANASTPLPPRNAKPSASAARTNSIASATRSSRRRSRPEGKPPSRRGGGGCTTKRRIPGTYASGRRRAATLAAASAGAGTPSARGITHRIDGASWQRNGARKRPDPPRYRAMQLVRAIPTVSARKGADVQRHGQSDEPEPNQGRERQNIAHRWLHEAGTVPVALIASETGESAETVIDRFGGEVVLDRLGMRAVSATAAQEFFPCACRAGSTYGGTVPTPPGACITRCPARRRRRACAVR